MATERGVVIKTDAASAWVKTSRNSACEGCSARGACHSHGGSDEMEVKVINDVGAKEGDRIVLSMEAGPLLKASFLLYVFPVLLLIIGAVIGQETAPYLHLNPSGSAAVAGFAFFGASLLIVKIRANKLAEKNEYRPRIIRIEN